MTQKDEDPPLVAAGSSGDSLTDQNADNNPPEAKRKRRLTSQFSGRSIVGLLVYLKAKKIKHATQAWLAQCPCCPQDGKRRMILRRTTNFTCTAGHSHVEIADELVAIGVLRSVPPTDNRIDRDES